MEQLRHSIKMASRLTGLSPHVIRIWERRYGAVEPYRSGTNRRLYSDGEIERLRFLHQAVATGHRIGNVAKLPLEQLKHLVAELSPEPFSFSPTHTNGSTDPTRLQKQCMDAICQMDGTGLEAALNRSLLLLGHQGSLMRVVAPLVALVGDAWQEGALTAAHEHFASAVIRRVLEQSARPYASSTSAPTLVTATPSGQIHELGAALIASVARNAGWRVVYLGVSLPAAEIAGAALQQGARAVGLSVVYPADDTDLPRELEQLRRFLPEEIHLIVGGRSANAYADTLRGLDVTRCEDLDRFQAVLEGLRERREATLPETVADPQMS